MSGREEIGRVVRTKARVKPVFVSVGYRITLPLAVEIVLRCTRGYRLPEPTRIADRLTKGLTETVYALAHSSGSMTVQTVPLSALDSIVMFPLCA